TAIGAALAAGRTVVGDNGSLSASSIRQPALIVHGRAQVLADGTAAGTSKLQELSIDGVPDAWTGKLDLNDNDLIIDYSVSSASPLTTIQNQVKSGFNGGAWTGNGITSATAAAQAATAHRTALGIAEA